MIISLLIAIIGIIPIVLAVSVLKLYKGSELSLVLFFYMFTISLWQLDIAVLYLKGTFAEDTILWLFKIFRMGPTFMVPIVFYLSYILVKKHITNIKNQVFYRILVSIFNQKLFVFLMIWSSIIYIINMTKYGIIGLKEVEILKSNTYFYFPEYGELQFLYLLHSGSFIFFVVFSLLISRQVQNKYLKDFLGTFSYCMLFLFVSGFLNFIPGAGALFSSFGIIIFSIITVFSFIRMHTMMIVNYNRLIERQKKLDYAGNLTASLVHEVKNNLQIIKGYSKLLSQLLPFSSESNKMNEMIQMAVQQLDELIQNYTQFIKYKSIDFKMVDLNEVIEQAIKISEEILKRKLVHITFEKKFRTLNAFANHTYLKQVFVNLIKNSLEAIPKDKPIKKIMISTDIQADIIFIDIIDTGEGIPTENWESIFDPFNSTKNDGMGLGLPFVKKIIFEHRGDIKVVQSSPKGTHFQIRLPQYSFSDF